MPSKRSVYALGIALVLAATAGCASRTGLMSGRAPTQPVVPVNVGPMTDAQAPLPFLTLGSVSLIQSGQSPNYTINAQIPIFQLAEDPRVQKLNKELSDVVQGEIATFREGLADLPAAPISSGSSFDLRYALVSPAGNIISMQILVEGYTDGAAHPYHLIHTVNYDLANGADLTLGRLFEPGADYLKVIADYCQAELGKRGIGSDTFAAGADPTEANYRNWNITADGLQITFAEDQVAPYAAGPQVVTLPAQVLQDILAPGGPLR